MADVVIFGATDSGGTNIVDLDVVSAVSRSIVWLPCSGNGIHNTQVASTRTLAVSVGWPYDASAEHRLITASGSL